MRFELKLKEALKEPTQTSVVDNDTNGDKETPLLTKEESIGVWKGSFVS